MLLAHGDGKELRHTHHGECRKDKKTSSAGMLCNDVSEYFEKVNFRAPISHHVLKR